MKGYHFCTVETRRPSLFTVNGSDLLDVKLNFRQQTLPDWFFGTECWTMKCLVTLKWHCDHLFFNSLFSPPQRYDRYCTSCRRQSHFLICSRTSSNWGSQTDPRVPGRTVLIEQKVFMVITSLVGLLFPKRLHIMRPSGFFSVGYNFHMEWLSVHFFGGTADGGQDRVDDGSPAIVFGWGWRWGWWEQAQHRVHR